MHPNHIPNLAGVTVTLAFFVLVAYVVTMLRGRQKVAATIAAVATLVGVLPAILYALFGMR